MDIRQAKELVIKAGHELIRTGLVARTWGNVSCRINKNSFVITPSGREYKTLAADDLVEVKISDLSYEGSIIPSSEMGIHRAVYQLRPNSNFVIHTHQNNASAISAAGLDSFKPISPYSEFTNEVICAEYALPGTKDLCENVTAALKYSSGNAIIMKNHGVLCFEEKCVAAFRTAYQLEAACKEFIEKKVKKCYTPDIENIDQHEINISLELGSVLTDCKAYGVEENILSVTDFDVVRFSKLGMDLRPLLDDFAQIVGTNMKTVNANKELILTALKSDPAVFIKDLGAICRGENESDAEAVSMILRKNCAAYFTASALGHINYIEPEECNLMRKNYLEKYSLLSVKNRMTGKINSCRSSIFRCRNR
ncbi:MAG: class II aldolase/adducin family protein [Eubacteriales bacterium]|nr:class II aldolase/adducin family protein [Eubacteriales bacterium]